MSEMDEIAVYGDVYEGDPADLHEVPVDQQLEVDLHDDVEPEDLSDVDIGDDAEIITFGPDN